jgi:hypothetical protein
LAQVGFLLAFALLLLNLAPTVYVGDSALLSTASFYLSTAHPPAYPLFITLGKLLTFLPLGSIAYKTNLVSALSGALAWLVLFLTIRYLTLNRWLAFSFAFLPLFTPLVFVESLKAEVYGLNAFLCLGVFYLGLRGIKEGDVRFLLLSALLFGLGSGNHHTLALMGLSALLAGLYWLARERRPRVVVPALLLLSAGLMINLHIYLRSLVLPLRGFIFSGGKGLEATLDTVLRKGYEFSSPKALSALAEVQSRPFGQGLYNTLRYLIESNYGPVLGLLLVALAVALLLLRVRAWLKLYLLLALLPWLLLLPRFTFSAAIPTEKDIFVVSPYYVPLLFLLPLPASVLLGRAYGWLKALAPKGARAAPLLLLAPLVLLAPVLKGQSLGKHYLLYDRMRDSLMVMPPLSWAFITGDAPVFGALYMQWTERLREDILSFIRNPLTDELQLVKGQSIFLLNRPLHERFARKRLITFTKSFLHPETLKARAARGRLFALAENALPEPMKAEWDLHVGPVMFMLLPKGADTGPAEGFLAESTPKLNYERALEVYAEDFFSENIKSFYAMALFKAALSKGGKEGALLASTALRMVSPSKYFYGYIHSLRLQGRTHEALVFLKTFQRLFPHARAADVAHVLEYLLLEETDPRAARAKYAYLREHDLLIYLEEVREALRDMASKAPHGGP